MRYKISYSEFTDIGNVRKQNEDSLTQVNVPNGQLFVICDGMGGAVGGKIASLTAVNSVISFFEKKLYTEPYKAIYQSIVYANRQIYLEAEQNPKLMGMGTTIAVFLINEESIYFGHVGDSRIFLRAGPSLYSLTKDHSFVNKLLDEGKIDKKSVFNHPNKNRILKALGIAPNVEPEVSAFPTKLIKNDEVLICSDGINDMLPDEEILDILYNFKEEPIDLSMSILAKRTLAFGGKDNLSAFLIRIEESPYIEREFEDKSIEHTYIEDETIKKNNHKLILPIVILTGILLIISSFFILHNFNFSEIKQFFIKKDSLIQSEKKQNSIHINPKDSIDKAEAVTLNDSIQKKRTQREKDYDDLLKDKTHNKTLPKLKTCINYYNKYKSKEKDSDDIKMAKDLAIRSVVYEMKTFGKNDGEKLTDIYTKFKECFGSNKWVSDVYKDLYKNIVKTRVSQTLEKLNNNYNKILNEKSINNSLPKLGSCIVFMKEFNDKINFEQKTKIEELSKKSILYQIKNNIKTEKYLDSIYIELYKENFGEDPDVLKAYNDRKELFKNK